MNRRFAVIALAVALSAGSLSAQGQVFWQERGVVVCDSTWDVDQAAASDGYGGIAVVWCDSRGDDGSVWAQRVDCDGNPVWQRNGVLLRDGNTVYPDEFSAVSDGSGGLIAVWREDIYRSSRQQVTAQRVDASGAARWGSDGVVVTGTDRSVEYEVAATSDGRGGAIVAWVVAPLGSPGFDSLVVQRLDSLGQPCWGTPGLVVATESVGVGPPLMCPDSAGGVCMAWSFTGWYVWHAVAQHIDSTGHTTWPGAWVSLFTSNGGPCDMTPLSGGYVIAGAFVDTIRAQRIDSAGQMLWAPQGCRVYYGRQPGILGQVRILPGPNELTYVVWSEARDGINGVTDIYAQLLGSTGVRQWDSSGVEVGSVNYDEYFEFGAVAGGGDGAIVSWPTLSGGASGWDIYAQRLDSAGRLLWGSPGLGVATDSGRQGHAPCVVTDERQGAIIAWGYSYAGRRGMNVQRVGDATGVAAPRVGFPHNWVLSVSPNPARGVFSVRYSVPRTAQVRVRLVDPCGRVVKDLVRGEVAPGRYNVRFGGTGIPDGVYYVVFEPSALGLRPSAILVRKLVVKK